MSKQKEGSVGHNEPGGAGRGTERTTTVLAAGARGSEGRKG